MYSLEERIFLVEHVLRAGDRYNQAVKNKFRETFPGKLLPHRDSVRDLMHRFRVTGAVTDRPRSGRPKKTKEPKELKKPKKEMPAKKPSPKRTSESTNAKKENVDHSNQSVRTGFEQVSIMAPLVNRRQVGSSKTTEIVPEPPLSTTIEKVPDSTTVELESPDSPDEEPMHEDEEM